MKQSQEPDYPAGVGEREDCNPNTPGPRKEGQPKFPLRLGNGSGTVNGSGGASGNRPPSPKLRLIPVCPQAPVGILLYRATAVVDGYATGLLAASSTGVRGESAVGHRQRDNEDRRRDELKKHQHPEQVQPNGVFPDTATRATPNARTTTSRALLDHSYPRMLAQQVLPILRCDGLVP